MSEIQKMPYLTLLVSHPSLNKRETLPYAVFFWNKSSRYWEACTIPVHYKQKPQGRVVAHRAPISRWIGSLSSSCDWKWRHTHLPFIYLHIVYGYHPPPCCFSLLDVAEWEWGERGRSVWWFHSSGNSWPDLQASVQDRRVWKRRGGEKLKWLSLICPCLYSL